MSNQVKIIIGGKEVIAEFGVNWFYKFFNEVSGMDLLVNGLDGVGTSKSFDICADLWYAGHKAWAKMEKQPESVTRDEVIDHVMGLNIKDAVAMITQYTDTLPKADPEGELTAQEENR